MLQMKMIDGSYHSCYYAIFLLEFDHEKDTRTHMSSQKKNRIKRRREEKK